MNSMKKYLWQWAMMYYRGGSVQDLGYYSLFNGREYRSMTDFMAQTAEKYPVFRGEENRAGLISRRMCRLMKEYHDFMSPSFNAQLYQGRTILITPYNAAGRWTVGVKGAETVVLADNSAAGDINGRIEKSGMKLKSGITLCTADILDAASLKALWQNKPADTGVYFSLGLLPLTESCENTGKAITSLAQVMTPADNLAFGFISLEGSNLPRGTPVFTPAEMESLLSCAGFNVYEDGQSIAPDGTEITFFLAVKKIDRHK